MAESRHKYMYENLGDHEFQLLINALLVERFPDYEPMPLRQADGGRDGVRGGNNRTMAYQTKWSSDGRGKDPLGWLETVVRGEEHNLKRLAAAGVRRYVLVTNVPSTGRWGTGTNDRLHSRLTELAALWGFEEMTCYWRETVDAMVDNAPDSLKWTYADMLVGRELMRYLIAEDQAGRSDTKVRKLLRTVARGQWDDDERVKFSQVDINREKVTDLFIDVHAVLLDERPDQSIGSARSGSPVNGAADYLIRQGGRCTLVRGAPGQGKSTLAQYVAQVHRANFVPSDLRPGSLAHGSPSFPIRLDLSDYSRWLAGFDVWGSDDAKRGRPRASTKSSIECFIADYMTHATGGHDVDVRQVNEIFDLVPCIVILDGLDEVGKPQARSRVVDEINRFANRSRVVEGHRIVVTTRPSANALPEPSPEVFDVLALRPFEPKQREEYLRKWTKVHGLDGREGRTLRKTYKTRISEPFLAELAGNPMQLTILLDLLHRHGEATPTQRTALYDAYVDLLLAREANKYPDSVRNHQDDLREIIPFLGWHLHSATEVDVVNTRMSVEDLKASIQHFLRTYGNAEIVVDELFEAASDRLWTLTSKAQGTYEFEVLPLREYFAARFLYHWAGEELVGFDELEVLRELMRRPYWLNTARFYGGSAPVAGVSNLADGVLDALRGEKDVPTIVAAWTLLTDGVFNRRPRRAEEITAELCSDRYLATLNEAWARGEIASIPRASEEDQDPRDAAWEKLTAVLAASPDHPLTQDRVGLLTGPLNRRRGFAAWWASQVHQRHNAGHPIDGWLRMARRDRAAYEVLDLDGLDLQVPGITQWLLGTGASPTPGGAFEAALVEAVLDGRCPDLPQPRSLPAMIAVAFGASNMIAVSPTSFDAGGRSLPVELRQKALKGLKQRRGDLAAAAKARRFAAGEAGSTFPWSRTATALYDAVGSCWLASQIAIMGAASPMQNGVNKQPGVPAFGAGSHPAALLNQVRDHAGSVGWWREQFEHLAAPETELPGDSDRYRAEWAAAMWCGAESAVVNDLFELWSEVFSGLSPVRAEAVRHCADMCASNRWLAELNAELTSENRQIDRMLTLRATRTRSSTASKPGVARASAHVPVPTKVPTPLLEVARARRWFKVDRGGQYR